MNEEQLKSLQYMYDLHARAMIAHCKCLGMNAENCLAVSRNEYPPYSDSDYNMVLFEFGLVDKNN